MELQEIGYGSEASSAVLNNNFKCLDEKILETNNQFDELEKNIDNKIDTLSSSVTSQIKTFQEQQQTTIEDVSSLSNEAASLATSAMEYFFPDYTLYERKENGVVHQAPCNGWILVISSNSNKAKHADLYIGKTPDNLMKVMNNGSNVVSFCGAMYLIKKGWYYKSTKVDNYYSSMNYGFIPLDNIKQ